MKQLLMFLCALLFALTGEAAPADNERQQHLAEALETPNTATRETARAMAEVRRAVDAAERVTNRALSEARGAVDASDREIDRQIDRAIAEARAAIDAAETAAIENQSLDELNKAAREQVVRELKLSSRQRKEFEPLYKAYREALDKAIDAQANTTATDEASQKRSLKAKLANIAATAQVKRDYVDKFAVVLTAEQIRQLYNTEGNIGTNIKRAAIDRSRAPKRLKGSARMVTQDLGKAGDYTAVSASSSFDITISPSAKTISVTANDNVIDYLSVEREGGKLKFRIDANNTENISIKVVLPASTALNSISASGFASVTNLLPMKGEHITVNVSSSASVKTDIEAETLHLDISGFGKFFGNIRSGKSDLTLSSSSRMSSQIVCTGTCTFDVSGFAIFSGSIEAPVFNARLSSSCSVKAPVKASRLKLSASGFAKFSGAMDCQAAVLDVSSSASIRGKFAAASFTATVAGFGKIVLDGEAVVESAKVTASSSGNYYAQGLRVANYDITASGFAQVNVWCSNHLKISVTSSAKAIYDGPCTVEALSENVRRR